MSWRRPSKRSSRLAGPSGPSKRYSFSTAIQGIRRRCAASASRARVSFFSSTRSFSRAACHSCGDTIGGVFIRDSPLSWPSRRQLVRSAGLRDGRAAAHEILPSGSTARSSTRHLAADELREAALVPLLRLLRVDEGEPILLEPLEERIPVDRLETLVVA